MAAAEGKKGRVGVWVFLHFFNELRFFGREQ